MTRTCDIKSARRKERDADIALDGPRNLHRVVADLSSPRRSAPTSLRCPQGKKMNGAQATVLGLHATGRYKVRLHGSDVEKRIQTANLRAKLR